jgi:lysophospholipase L1-like esterase
MNRLLTSAAVLLVGLAAPAIVHAADDPQPPTIATATATPQPTESATTPTPEPTASPSPGPTPRSPARARKTDVTSETTALGSRSTLVIIGDSTAAWFSNAVGSRARGWWSFAAAELGLTPFVSAENGSGMWARGNKCQGTNFMDRLGELDAVASDTRAVIVAGGRNDYHGCLNGSYKAIRRTSTEAAIRHYLEALATKVDALGIPREHVYVTTIWGATQRTYATYIWRQERAVAQELGFRYALVRYLDTQYTIDGTHPNLVGNQRIWTSIKENSDILTLR